MLKNINPEELNNRSSNSENIDDSQNINDDEQEPLCSFDISLNNGKKASLIIYDEDNYEQKVEDFCHKYKISPQDGQVLLKRVKEELEISSNNNISNNNNSNNNISKNNNKPKEEINKNINKNNINDNNMINNIPKKENLFLGNKNYVAKEGNKLDHILNESESMSLSESLKKSNDKVNNLIKDYNNIFNNNVQNNANMKQQIPDNNNNINIINNNNNNKKNELNNINTKPINNNNNTIFSQIPIQKTSMKNNNFIPGQNRPKYYIVNDAKNKNKKKQISKYPLKNTTNSTLYKFNNYSNIPNLNTTYQNNNNSIMMLNSPKENNNIKNNNYEVYSFNPNKTKTTFRNSLVGQKIEFINNNDFVNNNNNNKTNIKIMTPKTEVKYNNLILPYSTSPNAVKKEYNKSIAYGYPVTSNFTIEPSPVVNKKETMIYNYENPQIINKNNKNNNIITHSPIINNKNTAKVTKILDTYPITENNYCNQNIINSPKSLNINYDNLNNFSKNTYETIIKPEIEFTDFSKNNITTINSPNYNSTTNFDTTNNPIIEYNNNYDSITASPILNYDKYDSINNQIVEYHYDTQPLENTNNIENNNNNIYNTQSDFPIYENIVVEKIDSNNNNNDLNIGNDIDIVENNQVIEYEIQKNIVPEYTTYVETKNNNNKNNINNNINQIEEVIDINENIINNYNENNSNQEKKRNTIFISNVKKITDNEIVQNDNINENNNLNNINNNVNELDIYSDVNQVKSEENNIEDNYIQENENNYIIINNNNNANNSITKENDINIPRSSPNKTKENHNRNLSVVQTQNLDYKAQEPKKEKIISNIKPNLTEHMENKSNDIYIKKNIDLFNSPKNKIISNNTIKEAINLNMKNEANNINKKPENNIIQKYNIKENIPQIKQKVENVSDINKINKDTYKNSNSSANASPLNTKSINKMNLINNNNKNESLTSSNIYEDNNMSEKKKNIEKLEESLNQQNINENSTESKIIIEEENSERGPQDNCKKTTTKVELPKDTDESHYKESEIQYDNLSLDSKNNINNNSDKKNNLKNNNLYESNNENNNENKINFINEDDEIQNNINNNSSNYQNSNKKNDKNFKHKYNNSNNLVTDSNYYISNNYNINNNKKDKFENNLDKNLNLNRPKYKKNIVQQNSSKNKKGKFDNIYQKKEINNNKKFIPQKKPIMKVLTIRKTNIDKNNNNSNINNIITDKRSNSSDIKNNRNNRIKYNNINGKIKNPGERLYENYMKKLPKQIEKKQKLLDERLKEENKELLLKPKIDENSRRIIKRIRDNDDEKNRVEERLINYGNSKRQKHLIEYANKDLQNQVQNPFTPKINKISREIAEKNKQNRINETINLIEGKKHKYNFKTMDLDKEFGKRNRSIGNDHKNANSFINFDESKNNYNNRTKNTIKKHSNINSESNCSNNLNSYRNSKPDNNTIEENNQNSSRLNKTFDLNNAYRELYNSIDEKMDSDLTKFFGTNGELYSDNNNNISKKNINQKEKKTKSIFPDRSLTPNTYIKNYQNYNAFDYLYYESENKGKKNKKKQELSFKKNHPFKPRISTFAQNMKNKKESMNEFVNRISKNLEEIKTSNSKSKKNKQINLDKNAKNNDNNNFRPRISRGPQNINQRNVTVNLDGFYDQRITKEKKELQQSKKEDELEKKNLYNQKSKDIIIKMKIKKYKELFALLDSDQDGLISEDKIQLTKVEENILKNIKPILEELKQTKKEMNFKEFCLKLDKLMTEEKENNLENNK